ncbi:hypothetical protein JAAARDRAFT_301158 [Jaapia argillacea MUCL 33604]|uniref:Uncharacterized protein n=1 Tax=Jaapia argillacea MUCL 33604 TaxID=933084 RepID=A0A067Q2F9_9AGAM|nr:hypothetical protein JAAARDRAFT_301158 [Jaapia argillacea MUCL 33604]
MSNGTLYPPLPDCFYTGSNATCDAVSITMLQFLNITNHVTYNQHYCMNPPQDSCEFGYCPNPDVAGFYTRIADYVTNICLALIIFYAPEELVVSFYAQLLSVYSLFVTIVISIINQNLTRLHATIALVAAGSPLSIYMIVYALRTMLWGSTRMDPVYARGHERCLDHLYHNSTDRDMVWSLGFPHTTLMAHRLRPVSFLAIPDGYCFPVHLLDPHPRDWCLRRSKRPS